MTPKRAAQVVGQALKRLGRTGDPADVDAYLASEQFRQAMRVMTPANIRAISAALQEARQQIDKRLPLPPPGSHRVRWDEARVTRLGNAWRRHRGNVWRVARELRITEAAVKAAYHRFFVAAATAPAAAKADPGTAGGQSLATPDGGSASQIAAG